MIVVYVNEPSHEVRAILQCAEIPLRAGDG